MRKAVRIIITKNDSLLVMERNKFGNHYIALVGGGIDLGETAEQALYREVAEEAGITFTNPRLVFIEHAGEVFGTQYIYEADYESGEPALDANSEEAKITALGQNLYNPRWLPIGELAEANLLPQELKTAVLEGLNNGFPETPVTLTVSS